MKKQINLQSGFSEAPAEIFEYLLVVSPPEEIWNKVMEFKSQFHQRHNHIQAIKSKPHITLINFGEDVAKEELLLLRINEVVKFHEAFTVTLNGINHFQPHTIFIDLVGQQPIVSLVKALKEALQLPARNAFFSLRPHLTIAKGLQPDKFHEGLNGLAGFTYTASFPVYKIVLMKRNGRFSRYEIVREFELKTK